ncbi:MAG: hypothetical protein ABIF04_07240 [Chloroflexota bacterium]
MKKKRPVVISVICILGFIGAAITIPTIFSSTARSIGAWYPPYLAFSAAIGLVCMIGLWKMKKWSVILYTAIAAVNQVIMLAMGVWNVLSLPIILVVIAVMFSQFSKMD